MLVYKGRFPVDEIRRIHIQGTPLRRSEIRVIVEEVMMKMSRVNPKSNQLAGPGVLSNSGMKDLNCSW